MKPPKLAITLDEGLDQRLIAKLAQMHNIDLLIIPRNCSPHNLDAHLMHVEESMQLADGILLPGNKYDIHPKHYLVSDIHPETKKRLNVNPLDVRFDVEKKILITAMKRKLPFVAICGGMQLVNVVLGGTLTQHIPDYSSDFSHREDEPVDKRKKHIWENEFKKHILTGNPDNVYKSHPHVLKIHKESALGALYTKYNPGVNLNQVHELSSHHQGCFEHNLSPRLRIAATAEDGLIEAVEIIDYPNLCIISQYHIEYNVGRMANGIFQELYEHMT